MGISDKGAIFLKYCLSSVEVYNIATIGRQSCIFSKEYERLNHNGKEYNSLFAEKMLKDLYSVKSVDSFDYSPYENCSVVHDFNTPIPISFHQSYDVVLDAGTLEHVFDVKTAFNNVAMLTRVGGQIIHILPTNEHSGHGFYQFSAEFFFSLYSEGFGFSNTEVFASREGSNDVPFYKVSRPSGISRVEINSKSFPDIDYLYVKTKRSGSGLQINKVPQQSDYWTIWNGKVN